MGGKEKRGDPISPVIFKIGVALVFSISGFVYTFFRYKQGIKRPSKPTPHQSCPENCRHGDDDRDHGFEAMTPASCDEDRDGSILQEFNDFLNECNASDLSPSKNRQSNGYDEDAEFEKEIRTLRSKVKFLEERERVLETQLLEYYGLKEQETAVAELQNRLRIQNMETKLYRVKIESLQSDKRRLESQAADYAKVVAELEAAKKKINLLRTKLTSEAKENREQILKLQERVMKLQSDEKNDPKTDQDARMELERRKELEEELEELKKQNHSLKLENIELAEKLDSLQIVTMSSGLDDSEVEAMKEERQRLGQENDDLRKEIEQLREDRYADLEELVYLRWINACLRYELRNYQPRQGETVARDLSRTLSPKSEEKAKQLILEYANREGFGDNKFMNLIHFDCDQWSTSQFTDSDDLPSADRTNNSGKRRVFAKLMKLLQGKDNDVRTPASPLDVGSNTVSRSNSYTGSDSLVKTTRTPSEASRRSFDFQRSHSQGCKGAVGESSSFSRRISYDDSIRIFRRIDYDDSSENAAKTELVKYAEALQNSRGKVKSSVHRRSASLSCI
ncbi:protein CHUP1, chloroplastic-like [Andrographis paniculata]|uniref:protein CHUP1, chloroplastic-like n=1 Tax=Andrographis paniculata TaxID=175694 RepID=UPI0021E87712|nr:protein CHUP1, chloroplastic-like [Andrographis paniculata]XP_051135724.1 protein CHUP1, chloroplastic-like [Andrographis paniculata]